MVSLIRLACLRLRVIASVRIASLVMLAHGGLYGSSPNVVELSGKYPWEMDPEAAKCPVLLEFYASWCPHCQVFSSSYAQLAKQVDDAPEVFAYIVAAVDCAEYASFCDKVGIEGFPTMKDFPSGSQISDVKAIGLMQAREEGWLWHYVSAANQRALGHMTTPAARTCAGIRMRLEQENKDHGVVTRRWIPRPNVVWLADQQRALYQSLAVEPVSVGVFDRKRELLRQLRSFLELCVKGFPHKATQVRLAAALPLLDGFSARAPAVGDADVWTASLQWLEPALSKNGDTYFGCRGSDPHDRGYTCALWQTFHALLVNTNLSEARAPHPGLVVVRSWIEHFFGCEDCRSHFLDMAKTMAWDTVVTDDAAILWLWKAHNNVNKRLEGSPTEDPAWPKLQFPSPALCPSCWNQGTLSEKLVLAFNREFYLAGAQWTGPEDYPDASDSSKWSPLVVAAVCCVAAVLALVMCPCCRNGVEQEQHTPEATTYLECD